jgi:hypothetical protein
MMGEDFSSLALLEMTLLALLEMTLFGKKKAGRGS